MAQITSSTVTATVLATPALTLSLSKTTFYENEVVSAIGTLMSGATPLTNQTVSLVVNGTAITTGTTDGSGNYTIPFSIATAGSYNIQTVYTY